MSDEIPWPPLSARAALLSSPSGRHRFRHDPSDMRRSPTRSTHTSTSLLDMMRAAREDRDVRPNMSDGGEDEEEDEETLELQLAAINAKLKLKKLQQNKAKAARLSPQIERVRPVSPMRQQPILTSNELNRQRSYQPRVEIAVSPIRRSNATPEPKSPSRVLLGIDKGRTGADISLRRARTINSDSRTTSDRNKQSDSRSSRLTTSSACRRLDSDGSVPTKSFSERMNSARLVDKISSQRREAAGHSRRTGFNVDDAELQGFRAAAESNPARSPTRKNLQTEYTRDDILNASGIQQSLHRTLRKSRTMPELRQSPSRPISRSGDNPVHETDASSEKQSSSDGNSTLFEGFSQLHLATRVLPHSFLKRTLPSDQFTFLRVPDLLRQVTSPAFELPDSIVDFVVFGIVASKSSPHDHKKSRDQRNMIKSNDWEEKWNDGSFNQQKFMVFTLTDLKYSISLYLFGTAVPRYHRLAVGTVVAILNPGIMPPKPGKEDTGEFSLTLNDGDDTVLEIGTAQHLGFCSAVKKDGKECGQWVDSSKTEICEWHLNAEIAKTQSKRMGVNSGTNGFTNQHNTGSKGRGGSSRNGQSNDIRGKGLLPRHEGHYYDRGTQSHVYIANSNIQPATESTNDFRDRDDGFLYSEEGLSGRDKESIFRKRMTTIEKERDIAKKLSALNSGGAGGEYLRHQAESMAATESDLRARLKSKSGRTIPKSHSEAHLSVPNSTTTTTTTPTGSAAIRRSHILNTSSRTLGSDDKQNPSLGPSVYQSRKRTAESVRLSPVKVKKTRFLTDKGIKIAGRESIGTGTTSDGMNDMKNGRNDNDEQDENDDEDDEDDLEIV